MVDTERRKLYITDGSSVPARVDDPATSWEAALSIDVPALEAQVFKAVFDSGDRGLIGEEISHKTGLAIQTCTPRVKPLLRKGALSDTGYVKKATESNRRQRIVVATQFLEAFLTRMARKENEL